MSDQDGKKYVHTQSGTIPYSIGYMAKNLVSIGLTEDEAYSDAFAISIRLSEEIKENYTTKEIMEFCQQWYLENKPTFANRISYIHTKFKEFIPTVILLGGVTGIGKSTLAALLGDIFGVTSILGTDLIREVLRCSLSPLLLPTLHASSYVAHKEVDTSFLPAPSKSVVGFEKQARTVMVGVESAIEQAIAEEDFLIIEGVHLVPTLLKSEMLHNEHVIHMMLTLNDEESHRSRLNIREAKVKSRSENYIEHFSSIRKIQNYMIEQAKKVNIPIFDLDDNEKALNEIVNYIWDWKLKYLRGIHSKGKN